MYDRPTDRFSLSNFYINITALHHKLVLTNFEYLHHDFINKAQQTEVSSNLELEGIQRAYRCMEPKRKLLHLKDSTGFLKHLNLQFIILSS